MRRVRLVTAENRPPGERVILVNRRGKVLYERDPQRALDRQKKKAPTALQHREGRGTRTC